MVKAPQEKIDMEVEGRHPETTTEHELSEEQQENDEEENLIIMDHDPELVNALANFQHQQRIFLVQEDPLQDK